MSIGTFFAFFSHLLYNLFQNNFEKEDDLGFILQRQRRAIESLKRYSEPLPPVIDSLEARLENGRILYVLGVSVGVGTCSDIHGMDVLVVCEEKPTRPLRPRREGLGGCAYAVLYRNPTEAEKLTWSHPGGRECLQCVELLRVVGVDNESVIFSKTGHATVYPSL